MWSLSRRRIALTVGSVVASVVGVAGARKRFVKPEVAFSSGSVIVHLTAGGGWFFCFHDTIKHRLEEEEYDESALWDCDCDFLVVGVGQGRRSSSRVTG